MKDFGNPFFIHTAIVAVSITIFGMLLFGRFLKRFYWFVYFSLVAFYFHCLFASLFALQIYSSKLEFLPLSIHIPSSLSALPVSLHFSFFSPILLLFLPSALPPSCRVLSSPLPPQFPSFISSSPCLFFPISYPFLSHLFSPFLQCSFVYLSS